MKELNALEVNIVSGGCEVIVVPAELYAKSFKNNTTELFNKWYKDSVESCKKLCCPESQAYNSNFQMDFISNPYLASCLKSKMDYRFKLAMSASFN